MTNCRQLFYCQSYFVLISGIWLNFDRIYLISCQSIIPNCFRIKAKRIFHEEVSKSTALMDWSTIFFHFFFWNIKHFSNVIRSIRNYWIRLNLDRTSSQNYQLLLKQYFHLIIHLFAIFFKIMCISNVYVGPDLSNTLVS